MGTVGYQLVEGWGWFDALYMTVITITTVGFLEVHPVSAGGRVFTMVLALGGVFTAFYAGGGVHPGRGDRRDPRPSSGDSAWRVASKS